MFKDLVKRQRDFFLTHSTREVEFRKRQIATLKQAVSDHEARLCEAIWADFRKSSADTWMTEIAMILQEAQLAHRKLESWSRPKPVQTNLPNLPAKSFLLPEPYGVSLVIGAWNYPYQVSLVPAISALAAGNTVILKPSELAPNTSRAMAEILNPLFDPGVFRVVEGGVPETQDLLAQRFDKIFFTGSTRVGRIIAKAAAEHLTPITLELGGKSPALVLPDADLDAAARRITWGKFLNSGQTCIAPDYVVAHRSIKTNLVERIIHYIRKFYGSTFAERCSSLPSIVNHGHFDRLIGYLDPDSHFGSKVTSKSQERLDSSLRLNAQNNRGPSTGRLLFGGESDRQTRFIEPTIIETDSHEEAVMKDEIFGPILPVLTFEDLDLEIKRLASGPKPLAFYLFTEDRNLEQRILERVPFGGGCVNDVVMHVANPHLPFGGVGESGTGAYHGEHGFRAFSHMKPIMKKPTWFELKLRFPPFSEQKMARIKRLMRHI